MGQVHGKLSGTTTAIYLPSLLLYGAMYGVTWVRVQPGQWNRLL